MIKFLVTLIVGFYAGVYADQNFQIPRVDDPGTIYTHVKEFLEQYKKK